MNKNWWPGKYLFLYPPGSRSEHSPFAHQRSFSCAVQRSSSAELKSSAFRFFKFSSTSNTQWLHIVRES